MNDLRTAAQQALDVINSECGFGGTNDYDPRAIADALRERLAQPNDFNPDWDAMAVMVEEQQRMAKRIAELEAQQEQQPQMQPCAGRNCGSTNPNLHSAECFEDYEKSTGMNQWVGLTDEDEIPWDGVDAKSFAQAIEARLKEKNT